MKDMITKLIESRASVGRYDADKKLSDAELKELLRLATLSPSVYNMQNWKFIVVSSNEAKQKLHPIAFNQPQILDASATVIICGTLKGYQHLPKQLSPVVEANIMSQDIADGWVEMATNSHKDNYTLQRDEALRSGSLAGMTMMLAAHGMGIASGAMTGFDPGQLHAEFELEETDIPVMLVTLGYPAKQSWPQKPRQPVEDVVMFV